METRRGRIRHIRLAQELCGTGAGTELSVLMSSSSPLAIASFVIVRWEGVGGGGGGGGR